MRIIFYFCLAIFFTSCETEGPIPAYIKANRSVLITDPFTEGSNSAKINNLYMFVDNQMIGVRDYQDDSLVLPSIYTGLREITIVPAIYDDGSVLKRVPYPFYTSYIESLNLIPGRTTALNPIFRYRTNTSFGFIEDFENVGSLLGKDLDNDPATNLNIVSTNPRDPALPNEVHSGLIQVDTGHTIAKFSTSISYPIPISSTAVYIEMDYRCTNSFTVGLRKFRGGDPPIELSHIIVAPKENWNKIYLNITNLVKVSPADTYELLFLMQLDNPAKIRGELQLDNVKLLYFPQ
jgi:hypothetical protein